MTRELANNSSHPAPRRAAAVLLAAFLNLALLPCSMAFDVVEESHDCCPPEIELNASDCCEVGDANIDTRGGSFEPDAGGVVDEEGR